ncbi:MAG: bifunctional serine/threonine protein kinase/MFS transporter [Chloroflexota bacterium]
MPLATGQVLNNRYRIVKLLGQGGFGAVYRAWDTNLDCPRALKENLDTSPEAQRQFKREAQILTLLTHPNLPKVIDHFVVPGQGQYLVMDYVEGQDLQQMLDARRGPLPEAQALAWAAQVCEALAHLHALEPPIIHRDIKPANIKITPQGRAVLVDFGIAKIYDPHLSTTRGARAVTPGYSPHEQYGQGHTDARSDVYALGASLYHLLTGQQPVESIQRVVEDPLLPPEQANPALSPQACAAVRRAMAVDPKQRFQSIAEFRAALQPGSAHIPAEAPAPQPIPATLVIPPAGAAQAAADSQPSTAQPASTPKPVPVTPPQPAPTPKPVGAQGLRPAIPKAQTSAQSTPIPAKNKRQLAFLALFVLLYGLGYYLADKRWYLYSWSSLQSSPTIYTIILWAKIGLFCLVAPLWGLFSDRRGRRPALLLSAAGSALAMLATAYDPGIIFPFAQLLFSACFAGAASVALAYASDLVSEEQRPIAFGWLAASLTLVTYIFSQLLYERLEWDNKFFIITAVPCLLALGIALWLLKAAPNPAGPSVPARGTSAQAIHQVPRPPLFWLILLVFLASSAASVSSLLIHYRAGRVSIAPIAAYLAREIYPFVGQSGYWKPDTPERVVFSLLLAFAQAFGLGTLLRRTNGKNLLRASLITIALSSALIFIVPLTFRPTLAFYLVLGLLILAYGLFIPGLWSLASRHTSQGSGLVLGGVYGCTYLAVMLAIQITLYLPFTVNGFIIFSVILSLAVLLLTIPAFKRL